MTGHARDLRDDVLLIHPTGNANVRQAALALNEAGVLAAFHTTVAWDPNWALGRLLPGGLRSELARRSYPGIPWDRVHSHPWREAVRMLAMRSGWRNLARHETGIFSMDAICASLDRSVARAIASGPTPAAVYAYDDCALESFRIAREGGAQCIYELPIGHYRAFERILEEEQQLRPDWAPALQTVRDSPEKLARKDRELAQADAIFVASTFTAQTLQTYQGPLTSRIFRVPYGAPPVGPARIPTRICDPLRILYVGSIGLRKGIGYLIDAVEQLQVPYKLTLLGNHIGNPPAMKQVAARHRWIKSASNAAVLNLMRDHDVLVFPSLFEGFGLVILEAMSQGTVVIATPHTAAPDVIDDGKDGFIVPIRSAEAIARRLTRLAEDRCLLASLSTAAQEKARQRPWKRYREEWMAAIRDSLIG